MCVFNVMVRPGTHLVKHRESLSITNESQFIKTRRPKLKLLGLLCIKPDSSAWETNSKTLFTVY